MTIPRFYCPAELAEGGRIELPPQAAHHAGRVLRLEPGAPVTLFNGRGGEYAARLVQLAKQGAIAEILAWHGEERESPLAVTLAQAVSTGEKMDYTLQKAVELGVASIQPLASERSVVRLTDERAEKRVVHWQNVVIAACEQCGRNRVPTVAPVAAFAPWLAQEAAAPLKLMLSPHAGASLRSLPRPASGVILLVGPEGGFSPGEAALAQRCGFVAARLGPRVLRTETAALAALAALQALWGDFQ